MAGWFSGNSLLDDKIAAATSESIPRGEEDLALNLEICDSIRSKAVSPKDAMRALRRRISHNNPNVQLAALKLTDTCVKNGGNHFLVEIASREFIDNLVSILRSPTHKVNPDVEKAILGYIQEWASAFSGQMQLSYVETTYQSLKNEGFVFPPPSQTISRNFIDSSAPPEWADSEVCMRCRTPFSFTNRKHHCRNCGNVFDQNCSSKTLPLPHLGITTPVRVCDTCYEKLAPKYKKSGHHHASSTNSSVSNTRLPHSSNNTQNTSASDQEEADFAKALELSLAEANKSKPQPAAPPPITLPQPTSNTEDEDPDIKAAIEASLRDLEEQKRARAGTLSSTQSDRDNPIHDGPSSEEQIKPSPNELTSTQIENINLFSTLIDRLENAPRGAILKESQIQELYDSLGGLRPKLARSLAETIGKYDRLVDMHSKLTTVVRYYDKMLEDRLAFTYSRHGLGEPSITNGYYPSAPPEEDFARRQSQSGLQPQIPSFYNQNAAPPAVAVSPQQQQQQPSAVPNTGFYYQQRPPSSVGPISSPPTQANYPSFYAYEQQQQQAPSNDQQAVPETQSPYPQQQQQQQHPPPNYQPPPYANTQPIQPPPVKPPAEEVSLIDL